MSAVSVLVIDCTTTGASLPTRTPPIDGCNGLSALDLSHREALF